MKSAGSVENGQAVKIAYVHAMEFPCSEANAFDAVWTADALSSLVDTTFFVRRTRLSEPDLKRYYDIPNSLLKFHSMHLERIPGRIQLWVGNYYEKALAFHLRYHSAWAGFHGRKVLYVRHPSQLFFWGLQRGKVGWWRDWILCYESHDPLGLDPNTFQGTNPFTLKDGSEGKYRQAILQAARNFDIFISNTQAQADDLDAWTDHTLTPQVITLASPLPRIPAPPSVKPFGEKVVLGYIGTIDRYRGVDILLEAMRNLPNNFTLRIVGRFRKEQGGDADWLEKIMADPNIRSKVDLNIVENIDDVAAEIDRCDIMIQPASRDELVSRYVAPLKSYGYMMRGKPIIAGDVPCHRELFKNGKSAMLYSLNPKGLAECVVQLTGSPDQAQQIATEAWEQSQFYTTTRRAEDILSLIRKKITKID